MTSKSLIVLAITVSLGSAAAASPDVATDKIACGNPVGEESAAACTRLIAHAPSRRPTGSWPITTGHGPIDAQAGMLMH